MECDSHVLNEHAVIQETSKNLKKPQKTSKNLEKPQKTSKNLKKPQKTSKNLKKPEKCWKKWWFILKWFWNSLAGIFEEKQIQNTANWFFREISKTTYLQ